MSKRTKDASERDDAAGTGTLSSISLQTLKKIRISVGHRNRNEFNCTSDLERSLDDPAKLRVHYRSGEGQRPIFDRDDVVVNVEENQRGKKVLKSSPRSNTEDGRSKRSRSRSYSDHDRSRDKYNSRSPRSSRSYSRSPSRKESDRKVDRYKDLQLNKSPVKERGDAPSEFSDHRKSKDEENYRSAGRTSRDRYYKGRSPVPSTSKYVSERDRTLNERRYSDDYKKDKYKSPKRTEYKHGSPKRAEKHRSRSNSPRKYPSKHGVSDKDKYTRSGTPTASRSKRYSKSPLDKRRSRSPYSRKRTPSPHSRKRSVSPHSKRTSPRDAVKRRRSNTPYDRDGHGRDYSNSSRSVQYRRHSRSPHTSKHNRSPYRSDYSSKFRKRSRSPSHRDKHYDDHRPRSRSPNSRSHKYRKSSERSRRSHSTEKHELSEFEYYAGEGGFWIPAPFPRPGFMPRGVIPPMLLPRGMIRPGQPPYVIHRPYIPIQPPMHPFRPRHPIRYNQPNKQIKVATSNSNNSVTSTITTTVSSTSSATTTTASSMIENSASTSTPLVEEPVSDSESKEPTSNIKIEQN